MQSGVRGLLKLSVDVMVESHRRVRPLKEEFDNPYLAGVRSVPERRGSPFIMLARRRKSVPVPRSKSLEVNRTMACTNQRRRTAIISSVDLGAEI